MELHTELAPGLIHLLHAQLERPPVPIPELAAILTQAERARAARFVHEADAHRHIIGRGLARIVLAASTGAQPARVELRTTPEGKPFLEEGPSFSIAHSGPIVLLAFAADGRLGVDVEAVRDLRDLTGLARTSFLPEEVDAVCAVPAAERTRAFYRVWTRKEAMLKALGSGLSALGSLTVACDTLPDNALLRIDAPERLPAWTVRSVPSDPAVEAAVAWDRPIRRIVHTHP